MQWYNYIAAFFAGVFISNAIPHFVKGIAGDKFPTPFSNPPGKGLSSPTLNVAWALLNLIVAGLLFRAGDVSRMNKIAAIIFFVGFAIFSLLMSNQFSKKMKE